MGIRRTSLAIAGTISAAISSAAVALFAASFVIVAERGILRAIQLHTFESAVVGVAGQIVAIVLCTFALTSARTARRTLGSLAIAALTTAVSLGLLFVLFIGLWTAAQGICDVEGCEPGFWQIYGWVVLIALAVFLAAAALFATLNRAAPARDTAIRIGLLLLSAIPFLTVLGLAGTLVLTRRDNAAATEAERELVDA